MHVVLSLTLLSPAYYEKFFLQGRLTAAAGVSMLIGAAVAVAMGLRASRRDEPATPASVRNLALLAFAIGLHAAVPGFGGWFAPQTWPGMMPPITLLASLLGVAALTLALLPRRTA